MGFNEDERIRRKNRLQNQAHDYYAKLSGEGLSDDAISSLMSDLIQTDPTNPRNDIYQTVLKIIGRINGDESDHGSSTSGGDAE